MIRSDSGPRHQQVRKVCPLVCGRNCTVARCAPGDERSCCHLSAATQYSSGDIEDVGGSGRSGGGQQHVKPSKDKLSQPDLTSSRGYHDLKQSYGDYQEGDRNTRDDNRRFDGRLLPSDTRSHSTNSMRMRKEPSLQSYDPLRQTQPRKDRRTPANYYDEIDSDSHRKGNQKRVSSSEGDQASTGQGRNRASVDDNYDHSRTQQQRQSSYYDPDYMMTGALRGSPSSSGSSVSRMAYRSDLYRATGEDHVYDASGEVHQAETNAGDERRHGNAEFRYAFSKPAERSSRSEIAKSGDVMAKARPSRQHDKAESTNSSVARARRSASDSDRNSKLSRTSRDSGSDNQRGLPNHMGRWLGADEDSKTSTRSSDSHASKEERRSAKSGTPSVSSGESKAHDSAHAQESVSSQSAQGSKKAQSLSKNSRTMPSISERGSRRRGDNVEDGSSMHGSEGKARTARQLDLQSTAQRDRISPSHLGQAGYDQSTNELARMSQDRSSMTRAANIQGSAREKRGPPSGRYDPTKSASSVASRERSQVERAPKQDDAQSKGFGSLMREAARSRVQEVLNDRTLSAAGSSPRSRQGRTGPVPGSYHGRPSRHSDNRALSAGVDRHDDLRSVAAGSSTNQQEDARSTSSGAFKGLSRYAEPHQSAAQAADGHSVAGSAQRSFRDDTKSTTSRVSRAHSGQSRAIDSASGRGSQFRAAINAPGSDIRSIGSGASEAQSGTRPSPSSRSEGGKSNKSSGSKAQSTRGDDAASTRSDAISAGGGSAGSEGGRSKAAGGSVDVSETGGHSVNGSTRGTASSVAGDRSESGRSSGGRSAGAAGSVSRGRSKGGASASGGRSSGEQSATGGSNAGSGSNAGAGSNVGGGSNEGGAGNAGGASNAGRGSTGGGDRGGDGGNGNGGKDSGDGGNEAGKGSVSGGGGSGDSCGGGVGGGDSGGGGGQ